mmetsp:Transcript_25877/g.65796  ORF Transcript_25877/g.65796 Transcript_25877/m.65796 type:complete len:245 (+) Transcript_25877:1006-1740(+)
MVRSSAIASACSVSPNTTSPIPPAALPAPPNMPRSRSKKGDSGLKLRSQNVGWRTTSEPPVLSPWPSPGGGMSSALGLAAPLFTFCKSCSNSLLASFSSRSYRGGGLSALSPPLLLALPSAVSELELRCCCCCACWSASLAPVNCCVASDAFCCACLACSAALLARSSPILAACAALSLAASAALAAFSLATVAAFDAASDTLVDASRAASLAFDSVSLSRSSLRVFFSSGFFSISLLMFSFRF